MNTSPKSLLKLARDRNLPHPGMLEKFKISSWVNAYEWTRGAGNEERGFLNGVNWLNDNFQRVQNTREQFTFSREVPLSADELIQAHLAAANHAFYRISEEQMGLMAGQPDATMEQHLNLKSSLTHGRVEIDPNTLNMYRLDSLCGPFWEILIKHRGDLDPLFPEARPHQLDKFTFFDNETSMSQLFHSFSRIWQDLLYGDAKFFPHQNGVVLASTTPDTHLIKAVSKYRRDHHNATNALRIVRDWKKRRFIAEFVLNEGLYLHYQNTGGLTCVPWEELSEETQMTAFYHRVAPHYMIDEHLHSILDCESSEAKDQLIRNVLNVWFHLAVLSAQIRDSDLSKASPRQWGELLEFAPRFRSDELIDNLARCTNMTVTAVKTVVEILSFDPKDIQNDLWSQPLLVLGDYVFFL